MIIMDPPNTKQSNNFAIEGLLGLNSKWSDNSDKDKEGECVVGDERSEVNRGSSNGVQQQTGEYFFFTN